MPYRLIVRKGREGNTRPARNGAGRAVRIASLGCAQCTQTALTMNVASAAPAAWLLMATLQPY